VVYSGGKWSTEERLQLLLGEYEHALDDKNRVTLPARFRQAFVDGVFVVRGIEPCLLVYPREGWDRLVATRMDGLDPFSKEARQMSRFVFAGATETDLDKQGRIMLPPPLVAHAGLRKEVVVAGLNDHLELWEADAWRTEIDDVGRSVERVAERLASA
jgi:MraZ protein